MAARNSDTRGVCQSRILLCASHWCGNCFIFNKTGPTIYKFIVIKYSYLIPGTMCLLSCHDWKEGANSDPVKQHERHSPRCPFLCKLPVGNIPVHAELDGVIFVRNLAKPRIQPFSTIFPPHFKTACAQKPTWKRSISHRTDFRRDLWICLWNRVSRYLSINM